MLNAKLAPVFVLLGVTAMVWGCGDDPKTSGTGGRGAAAGSAGKGGAGSGGTAGGSSGKGGAGAGGTAGGSSGKGGAGAGGTAGNGGTAGKGGNGGTAGTLPLGGMGGIGGEGGDAAGAGGQAGGSGNLTLDQACAAVCADKAPLPCEGVCVASCVGDAQLTAAPDEYIALLRCEAAELGPSDYECFTPSAGPDAASASWNGPCETELCAWTCADASIVEENTYDHCMCP